MSKLATSVVTVALLGISMAGYSFKSGEKKMQEETLEAGRKSVYELAAEPDSTGYLVRVGDMAPDFSIELTDGKRVTLSSLRGKVVMLQFTASWCGVCRKEMPFIERDIWQKHQGNREFALIGVDRDEPLEKVLGFAKATGVTYPLGLDPGADIFGKYALKSSGITRNVLIDREGRIVKLTRLYNEQEFASLVAQIDELLK